jgi:hypothetical protein
MLFTLGLKNKAHLWFTPLAAVTHLTASIKKKKKKKKDLKHKTKRVKLTLKEEKKGMKIFKH